MKNPLMKLSLLALFAMPAFSACNKEKGENNEEEVITNVRLTFSPVSGGGIALPPFEFNDPDGPGGIDPLIDNIVLEPNTAYNVSVEVLNQGTSLNDEIIAENQSHRFYFLPSGGLNITVSNLDLDFDALPLGLTSTWTTGAAANGSVRVVLRHYAGRNKGAGDAANDSKSTSDIDITFPTIVN